MWFFFHLSNYSTADWYCFIVVLGGWRNFFSYATTVEKKTDSDSTKKKKNRIITTFNIFFFLFRFYCLTLLKIISAFNVILIVLDCSSWSLDWSTSVFNFCFFFFLHYKYKKIILLAILLLIAIEFFWKEFFWKA